MADVKIYCMKFRTVINKGCVSGWVIVCVRCAWQDSVMARPLITFDASAV